MFSGIIEACETILKVTEESCIVRIHVRRPVHFDDLKNGDSVAVNGICLTVEKFDKNEMVFALGLETQRVLTGQKDPQPNEMTNALDGVRVNLERSLRFGDRVHGHLVTGHVDTTSPVVLVEKVGDNLTLRIKTPQNLRAWIWKKGSITVHGVSLTVNEVNADFFQVGLIPETLLRTNLSQLKAGDLVNIEADYFARAIRNQFEFQNIPIFHATNGDNQ